MTSPPLESRLNLYAPTVISVFRIIVGLLFALHGSMILLGWPLDMKTPIGTWPGWWAGLIEFLTGVLVTIGFLTRPAAFLASGTMAVAYFWQHWPFNEGSKVFWPFGKELGGNSGEPAILFCFAFLLIFFIGPGAHAIDTVRRRRIVTGTAAPVGQRQGLLDRFRRR
jgi:putative oxidoreductase